MVVLAEEQLPWTALPINPVKICRGASDGIENFNRKFSAHGGYIEHSPPVPLAWGRLGMREVRESAP